MPNIFGENSDSDTEVKTNNEYAKNYDVWRKKEELNKLKTKYGEDAVNNDSSTSSSDDDEEGIEVTEEVEKEFYKTLSFLKNKDPKIYDKDVVFFDDRPSELSLKKKKKNKEQPMYINDYERKIILEKNGILSDDEDIEYDDAPKSPTYVEEQQHIKKAINKALENIGDENGEEENCGGLYKVRQKTKEDKEELLDYKGWLAGQTNEVKDDTIKTELKPLKEFWSNPNLDTEEKFLRDYILNKKFLDKEDENYVPTYDEIIHDSDESLSNDEEIIEKQEEFEHKYNFRYEEPDQDFIKRYPRTIENSLRKTDDKRKLKRAELKERKKKEKEEKMADLKQLQELKRKEIEEKIEKLKEITGNTNIAFEDEDVEGDFDPEAHDRRMQALFDQQFYEGPEDEQKPEFHDIDEELELENWEKWNGPDDENDQGGETTGTYEPHCEDDNFNMNADDHDPNMSTNQELIENSRSRKKRKRKSKFAEALSKPKPKYDPNDKNFEKYFEEYYKLDCEDIIGDIPCRFKYREVVPNDFGLTVEEILLAKDRELNKWCSLKKAVQYRSDHVEKYEQTAYAKKGRNVDLKKKILPSLFSPEPEDQESSSSKKKTDEDIGNITIKKSKENDSNNSKINKNLKRKNSQNDNKDQNQISVAKSSDKFQHEKSENKIDSLIKGTIENIDIKKKKKKKKKSRNDNNQNVEKIVNNKNTKLLIKKSVKNIVQGNGEGSDATKKLNTKTKNIKKKQKVSVDGNKKGAPVQQSSRKRKLSDTNNESKLGVSKKKFKKNVKNKDSINLGISDSRLAAYGINPKKFKNKLKYGKS